jgi:signal transduction histidine kinase
MVLAERNRIARALHDTLAQGFAGIAFQLEAVADKLNQAPAQARQHLNLALSMVRHSLVEARRSVMNLRSSALESCDLANALADTARHMMGHRSVDVSVQTSGPARMLSPKVEDNFLRVGQEAVTNSLKHSQATRIQIVLDYQPTLVRLSVQDNGRGFEPNGLMAANGGHFGLVGMRERAKQIGGKIEIRSNPGVGTEVVLEIATHRAAPPPDYT